MTDDRPKSDPDEQRRQAIVDDERNEQHRLIKRSVFARKRQARQDTVEEER